jgi:hypothetical protein
MCFHRSKSRACPDLLRWILEKWRLSIALRSGEEIAVEGEVAEQKKRECNRKLLPEILVHDVSVLSIRALAQSAFK